MDKHDLPLGKVRSLVNTVVATDFVIQSVTVRTSKRRLNMSLRGFLRVARACTGLTMVKEMIKRTLSEVLATNNRLSL